MPVPWPTATPPAGWLKCDGRAFTKEQYPVLARVYPTLRLKCRTGQHSAILSWQCQTMVCRLLF
ncbi:phage tail protein [Escherichia coli]|uniref:phage tail protein n=1 Tax=Escherichia coli TaxID=562 RepID=UPI003F4FDAC6